MQSAAVGGVGDLQRDAVIALQQSSVLQVVPCKMQVIRRNTPFVGQRRPVEGQLVVGQQSPCSEVAQADVIALQTGAVDLAPIDQRGSLQPQRTVGGDQAAVSKSGDVQRQVIHAVERALGEVCQRVGLQGKPRVALQQPAVADGAAL